MTWELAKESDKQDIERLYKEAQNIGKAYLDCYKQPFKDVFDYLISKKEFWICREGKLAIGFMVAKGNFLHFLFISEKYRNKGYGTKALNSWAEGIQLANVTLDSWEFWKKNGFEINEPNISFLVHRKGYEGIQLGEKGIVPEGRRRIHNGNNQTFILQAWENLKEEKSGVGYPIVNSKTAKETWQSFNSSLAHLKKRNFKISLRIVMRDRTVWIEKT